MLKGENQIKKLKHVADILVFKVASQDGVEGIVLLGGLVRGFVDRFSDLDVLVFLSKKDKELMARIHKIGGDEGKRSGIDVDLEIHVLKNFRKLEWNETDRWDFSKAKIVYDSVGRVDMTFKEKSTLQNDFWVKRIVRYAEHLKWYCCPPKRKIGTVAGSWIERGDLIAAHHCLSYSVDLLLKMVFALNKEFLPPPKWRVFYSRNLKWLPEDYEELITQGMRIEDFSSKEFNRRLKAIQQLWQRIIPKVKDETGLNLEQASKYYVQKILQQTAIPSCN